MSKRKRLKGAKPDADEVAFNDLHEKIRKLSATVASASPALMEAVTVAIKNAVEPYQAMLAQQEKDALAEAHPGWGTANIHHFPGVLT